jgi:hypothetical protein
MHAAKPLRELHPSQNPETWLLDSKSQVDFKPGSGFVFQFYCQFLSSNANASLRSPPLEVV